LAQSWHFSVLSQSSSEQSLPADTYAIACTAENTVRGGRSPSDVSPVDYPVVAIDVTSGRRRRMRTKAFGPMYNPLSRSLYDRCIPAILAWWIVL
jgi:hypothetical protein